jgi:hypothetical protein
MEPGPPPVHLASLRKIANNWYAEYPRQHQRGLWWIHYERAHYKYCGYLEDDDYESAYELLKLMAHRIHPALAPAIAETSTWVHADVPESWLVPRPGFVELCQLARINVATVRGALPQTLDFSWMSAADRKHASALLNRSPRALKSRSERPLMRRLNLTQLTPYQLLAFAIIVEHPDCRTPASYVLKQLLDLGRDALS